MSPRAKKDAEEEGAESLSKEEASRLDKERKERVLYVDQNTGAERWSSTRLHYPYTVKKGS